MKYFKAVYNSSLWAMVIAITCFRSMWLEMRVNTGYVFYGGWLILSLLLIIILFRSGKDIHILVTPLSAGLCTGYGLLLYGSRRIQVVPATIIRRGIHQTRMPFREINQWMTVYILAGMLCILTVDIVRYIRTKQKI